MVQRNIKTAKYRIKHGKYHYTGKDGLRHCAKKGDIIEMSVAVARGPYRDLLEGPIDPEATAVTASQPAVNEGEEVAPKPKPALSPAPKPEPAPVESPKPAAAAAMIGKKT